MKKTINSKIDAMIVKGLLLCNLALSSVLKGMPDWDKDSMIFDYYDFSGTYTDFLFNYAGIVKVNNRTYRVFVTVRIDDECGKGWKTKYVCVHCHDFRGEKQAASTQAPGISIAHFNCGGGENDLRIFTEDT